MKKILVLLAGTVLAGILLVGCGSDSNGGGSAAPETAPVIGGATVDTPQNDGSDDDGSIPATGDTTTAVETAPVTPQGCELTAALQGRWEGVADGIGAVVAIFDGDSIVEYQEGVRGDGSFAVGEGFVAFGANWNRIEFLWDCERGHEVREFRVLENQLAPDVLYFVDFQLTRVED